MAYYFLTMKVNEEWLYFISWSEFNKFNLMVSEGEKAARAQLLNIRKEINKFNAPVAKCKRFLKHFLKINCLKAAIY